ncbi:MAG: T9SS type A sorting domain-containing protein [Bacteroidota bacterium]
MLVRFVLAFLLALAPATVAVAQPSSASLPSVSPSDGVALAQRLAASSARTSLAVGRPQVAVAPDGSYAIAYEAFVQAQPLDEWRVRVQRFAADGRSLGAPITFEPEDVCLGTDVWNSDFLAHVELEYGPDGTLYVAMLHGGLRDLFNGFQQGSETVLGVIAPDGRVVDLNPANDRCVQYKPTFDGLSEEANPRIALTERDILLVQDGRFTLGGGGEPEVDNSVMHVVVDGVVAPFSQQSITTVPEVMMHPGDPFSRQEVHTSPDVAAADRNVQLVWQRCPYQFVVQNQQVVAQLQSCRVAGRRATVANGTASLVGSEVILSDAPAGTFSIAPSIAGNVSGQRVVVWADTRTGTQGDVFAQRLDASGQPVGGNVRVSDGSGQIYARPEVAVRPNGAFAVAWTDTASTGLGAFVRRYDQTGQPLGPPERLGSAETGLPAIAAWRDDYLIAWLSRASNGTVTLFSSVDGQPVDAETDEGVPAPLELAAYPNPTPGRATLTFGLAEAAPVRLAVYDLLGRAVRRLDGPRAAGTHALSLDLSRLPAGVYVVRLEIGGRIETQRLTVTR